MKPITGDIDYIHQFVNMIEYNVDVTHPNGTTETVQLCKPAMGYSFGAGTTVRHVL
jgi:neutral ceramidase